MKMYVHLQMNNLSDLKEKGSIDFLPEFLTNEYLRKAIMKHLLERTGLPNGLVVGFSKIANKSDFDSYIEMIPNYCGLKQSEFLAEFTKDKEDILILPLMDILMTNSAFDKNSILDLPGLELRAKDSDTNLCITSFLDLNEGGQCLVLDENWGVSKEDKKLNKVSLKSITAF